VNSRRVDSLFDELLWVHRMIRRDLETVRKLVAGANGDAPAAEIRDGIEDLKTNGPLWKLKVNCLRYCAFVHSHHNAEDALLFPESWITAEAARSRSLIARHTRGGAPRPDPPPRRPRRASRRCGC
jgi:hypothetical protein